MSAPPLSVLSPLERLSFRAMSWANSGAGSGIARFWQREVLPPFVGLFVARRLEVRGLERLRRIAPEASILLVANHRSFFDLFVLGWILDRTEGLRRRVSFPVRANFFYESPLGLLICLLLSGGAMFPPVFRDPQKRALNAFSMDLLVDKLREPGNLVGFHPEGTRSRASDPYALLRAQPGAGVLALKARPVVVPAFIEGLSNSVVAELRASVRRSPRIVAVFGEPLDLPGLPPDRLTNFKRCADDLLERIRALGEEARAVREELRRRGVA